MASSKAPSTTPTTSSSTVRTRCAGSITSARCERSKKWPASWVTTPREWKSGDCPTRAAPGSIQHLFNGEYYIQQVRGQSREAIPHALLNTIGADDPAHPEYQVGKGCLVDQLVGQYAADVAGLGALVDPTHCRTTLESIYRYNYKRSLMQHDNVQRTFVLNDEAALVVGDYAKAKRPDVPFPYYAEVFTGLEYTAASNMIYAGLVSQGVECVGNIRAPYNGERRNPWDEAECGSHYARAMAAWTVVLALSGFRYDGPDRRVVARPRLPLAGFTCFWSSGTGWGTFTFGAAAPTFGLRVFEGTLIVGSLDLAGRPGAAAASIRLGDQRLAGHVEPGSDGRTVTLDQPLTLKPGQDLVIA